MKRPSKKQKKVKAKPMSLKELQAFHEANVNALTAERDRVLEDAEARMNDLGTKGLDPKVYEAEIAKIEAERDAEYARLTNDIRYHMDKIERYAFKLSDNSIRRTEIASKTATPAVSFAAATVVEKATSSIIDKKLWMLLPK